MNKIMKNTAVLTAITMVAGLLLGFVYEITKEPIQKSKEVAKQKAYQEVMKDAKEFTAYDAFDTKEAEKIAKDSNIPGCEIREVVVAKDANKEEIGYVLTTASKEGYGGEIQLSVGIRMDGTVAGMEILSINETAGLGMKAQEKEFKNQFHDVQTERFTLKKDNPNGNVDALSGATITSKAVTNAVNAGLAYYENAMGGEENE